ncbi:MAG: hypothetical protein M1819_007326 [Sarea resinae]|nr:MAG: hypothetical protein M1819_007326 [Sarea resinae]
MQHIHLPAFLAALLSLTVVIGAVAIPVPESSVSLRSTGAVAEHFDQGELVKRVSLALVAKALGTLGAITYTACQAPIVPQVQATICAVAVVASLVGALATLYRGLNNRDEYAPTPYWSNATGVPIIHYYPGHVGGASVLSQLKQKYAGTPLLVSHHDCYTTSCFQVHYSNKNHTDGGLIHKLSVSPRRLSTSKRQSDENESGSASSDGSEVYGDYVFTNTNEADEHAFGYDGDFPTNLETQVGQNSDFTNQGYICFDVEDADDSDRISSTGYLALSQDEQISDPDDEQSYMSTCATA